MPDISVAATAPSARFALPSDRQYLAGRHVWAQIEDGIVTVGVTAPLGEVLWYTPDVEFWAVDRWRPCRAARAAPLRWARRSAGRSSS